MIVSSICSTLLRALGDPYALTQTDLMGDFPCDVFNPRLYKD